MATAGFANMLKKSYETYVKMRGHWAGVLIWIGLGAAAIVGLWAFNASRAGQEEQDLRSAAIHRAESLAEAYAKQVERSLEKLDEISLYVKYNWETSERKINLEALQAYGVLSTLHFKSFLIMDAAGRAQTSTIPNARGLQFADRLYFKYHAANPGAGLRLSRPTVSRATKKNVIHVTRRLDNRDGSFGGVLVIGAAKEFFGRLTDEEVFKNHGFQALIGNDHDVRFALISGPNGMRQDDVFHNGQLGCTLGSAGNRLGGWCFADGQPRYVASALLESYPYTAVVGLPEDEVLKPSFENRAARDRLLGAGSFFVALFSLFAAMLSVRLSMQRAEAAETTSAYRLATENGRDGFYLWKKVRDPGGLVTDFQLADCNERGAELFGTTRQDMVGTTFTKLYGAGAYRDDLVRSYIEIYDIGYKEDEYEVPEENVLAASWLNRKFSRTVDGLAVTMRDIGEKIAYKAEMNRLANEDGLTGLPNRHWLSTNLPSMLEAAKVNNQTLALLFIDLDDFKNVNDTQGHAAGDSLLKAAAERLRSMMRPGDHVVRLGGDEFTVMLRSAAEDQFVQGVASRLVDAFKEPFCTGGVYSVVGASVGVALYPDHGSDAASLLRHADFAMYEAKMVKGTICFYSEALGLRRLTRLTTEQELACAVTEDQLVVHYQPRVEARSGDLVGMEALVRWVHPVRGLLGPQEFIPIAETSDLILRIGEVVLFKVAAQLNTWRENGLTVVPVSVNISPRHFNNGQIVSLFTRCLRESRLPARLLEVEITESAMIRADDHLVEQLAALSNLGIKTHVDDFGTGYSSLALLQRLSLDVLKIDRAFIADLAPNTSSEILCRAIVTMAHALGMTVVAEGVETSAQASTLKGMRCDELQGYLISRPVSAEQAAHFLEFSEALKIGA
jgi:diguanylate cyclase (GGDEF)-like protein